MVMVNRDYQTLVERALKGFSGQCSVAFHDLQTGDSFQTNGKLEIHSASLIKIPILVVTLQQIARNHLCLEQKQKLTSKVQVDGSGILHNLSDGLELSLRDLLKLMIIVSDNTATNMVIDLVGIETVNQFCRDNSLVNTELIDKLQLGESEQSTRKRNGEFNHTTTQDMCDLLQKLIAGKLLPTYLNQFAIQCLKEQQFKDGIARYLPIDGELYTDTVEVASKYGCLRGTWHDVGIIYKNGLPLYVLAVMTNNSKDLAFHAEQEGMMLIAQISKTIFNAYLL